MYMGEEDGYGDEMGDDDKNDGLNALVPVSVIILLESPMGSRFQQGH